MNPLYVLNNNGDSLIDSSVSSRKLYSASNCTDQCTPVGICDRELCLMYSSRYM